MVRCPLDNSSSDMGHFVSPVTRESKRQVAFHFLKTRLFLFLLWSGVVSPVFLICESQVPQHVFPNMESGATRAGIPRRRV